MGIRASDMRSSCIRRSGLRCTMRLLRSPSKSEMGYKDLDRFECQRSSSVCVIIQLIRAMVD
jgi:hypothetical protein